MMKKCFLIPAMLSLALVLMVADSAQAQRRGGGYRGGGNYGRGYYGGGGNYGRGYYGGGGNYGRGYYGGGGYYGNSYYSASQTSFYYDPAPVVVVQYAPVAADTAHIRVIVPDPTARVWMNGSPTQQTGTERLFSTPPLTPGYSYSYQIRATWTQGGRETTQERVVAVIPGQTAVVDFR